MMPCTASSIGSFTPSSRIWSCSVPHPLAAANKLNNYLQGNDGANSLYGDAGNDELRGGGGNDTIIGGLGIDMLYGDAVWSSDTGADVFEFRSIQESGHLGAAADQIVDFLSHRHTTQGDKIDLSAIDANTTVAGDQAFQFIGNNNAFVPEWGAGQLRCNGGFVEGDVDGDLNVDFRIQVFQTDNLLIEADFIL
jgi:serralysin